MTRAAPFLLLALASCAPAPAADDPLVRCALDPFPGNGQRCDPTEIPGAVCRQGLCNAGCARQCLCRDGRWDCSKTEVCTEPVPSYPCDGSLVCRCPTPPDAGTRPDAATDS